MAMRTDDRSSIKVIDFGLASVETVPKPPAGTPLWTAPEKFLYRISSEPWTGKIDVWSVGLIGLELLCGLPQPPQPVNNAPAFGVESPYAHGWHGRIRVRLATYIKHHILSSAKPNLVDTIYDMLEENPKQRLSARTAVLQLGEYF